MTRRIAGWFLAGMLLSLAACAEKVSLVPVTPVRAAVSDSTRIIFCAMGDVPYEPPEEALLARQLVELPREAKFVVHVGDIQHGPGLVPVTETRYDYVAGILRKSPMPLFIIPGDNEFNDAPNVDDAWRFWTKHFMKFDEQWKFPVPIARQPERQENLAFVDGNVLFVAFNMVGGRVHDASEWRTRHAQDLAWVKQHLQQKKGEVACAVIFTHANPMRNHNDFMGGFIEAASAFEKPILFIHGDGHRWIEDRPYAAKNILRIQVDQGGIAPPLKVTVTKDEKEPFVLDRRMRPGVAGVPPTVK